MNMTNALKGRRPHEDRITRKKLHDGKADMKVILLQVKEQQRASNHRSSEVAGRIPLHVLEGA